MDYLEFTSRDGKNKVKLMPYNVHDKAQVKVFVNDKIYGEGKLYLASDCSKLIQEKCIESNSKGIVNTDKGPVCISEKNFDKIYDMVILLQSEIDNKPEVIKAKLIVQRNNLLREIGYIVAAQAAQHVLSVEHASEHGFMPKQQDYLQKEIEARKELSYFDILHPEVKIWIQEEKDERIERNMWN